MRSLFWKIFFAFWFAMVLITFASVLTSFQLARSYGDIVDEIDRRELMREIESVIETDGVDGFDRWLEKDAVLPDSLTIYLIGVDGNDALGRTIPPYLKRQWSRFRERFERRGEWRRNRSQNFDRSRRDPREFVSPDGKRYRPMLGTAPPAVFGVLEIPRVAFLVLLIGFLISAAVCYLLSRYLSRPISRISNAAGLLAAGNLGSRVGEQAYRADELGALAKQFDRMANELEQSELSRRDLLRNISHELRSPLARIQVAMELARRSPEAVTQNLERIEHETVHMDQLISQVLELVRLQQTAPAQTELVDLVELLNALVEDARFEGVPLRKRIHFEHTEKELPLETFRELLSSAIENVLRNAVAHTPPDSTVTIRLSRLERSLAIQINDQGKGVSEQNLERLFEPFYRESDNELSGAGVGLAITSQVMTLIGGEITARNLPEGGLGVRLNVPASIRSLTTK
ncbi:MAG: ATP-binding protein [Gammaproteobacteria bacterium]